MPPNNIHARWPFVIIDGANISGMIWSDWIQGPALIRRSILFINLNKPSQRVFVLWQYEGSMKVVQSFPSNVNKHMLIMLHRVNDNESQLMRSLVPFKASLAAQNRDSGMARVPRCEDGGVWCNQSSQLVTQLPRVTIFAKQMLLPTQTGEKSADFLLPNGSNDSRVEHPKWFPKFSEALMLLVT